MGRIFDFDLDPILESRDIIVCKFEEERCGKCSSRQRLTMPRVRAELQASEEKTSALAERYGLIVSSESNFSVPGVSKNLLDWLSSGTD